MTKVKTILVADDESLVRELLSIKLREKGFEVIEAADGKETLGQIREKRPELVLLDVKMPEKNGIEVCRTVRKDKDLENTKIIIFTAKAELADRGEGMRAGADYYLTKPARFAEVLNIINKILS